MASKNLFSKMKLDELIERFLDAAGIPQGERDDQRQKLLEADRFDIERRLAFFEEERDTVSREIEAAIPIFQAEERQRAKVSASGFPKVRDWLRNALEEKTRSTNIDAFTPFQDEIRNETAYDDLHIFFLGLEDSDRLNWNEAIVDVAAYFLESSPGSPITEGLLSLVQKMDEVPKLALLANAPKALLEAHCKGWVDLAPTVALSVFRDGCWRFVDLWNILFKVGDEIFPQYLEEGELDRAAFESAAHRIVSHLGFDEAADLAAGVAVPEGWRRYVLSVMLQLPEQAPLGEAEPFGIRLGIEDVEVEREVLERLVAFGAQHSGHTSQGAVSW